MTREERIGSVPFTSTEGLRRMARDARTNLEAAEKLARPWNGWGELASEKRREIATIERELATRPEVR